MTFAAPIHPDRQGSAGAAPGWAARPSLNPSWLATPDDWGKPSRPGHHAKPRVPKTAGTDYHSRAIRTYCRIDRHACPGKLEPGRRPKNAAKIEKSTARDMS